MALADGVRRTALQTVLEMTAAKTAVYTIELPLRMAGVLAGTPEHDDTLRRAGSHLGLAYQLQDDLLSAFGNPSDHGKDPLSDLREGKQTALVAIARDAPGWEHVRDLLGRPDLTEEQADTLRAHLSACGARGQVETLVAREADAARCALDGPPPVPAACRDVLDALMARLDHRVA